MNTDKAYTEGLKAGHTAYENLYVRDWPGVKNPYPLGSEEYYRWLDGWSHAFESAEENDV